MSYRTIKASGAKNNKIWKMSPEKQQNNFDD